MYQFCLLNNAQAGCFQKLIYPTYRPLLKTLDANNYIIAVGVYLDSQPIGLGLAVIDKHEAEVLSLFIHPEHREKGLGKALLNYLETELQQRGCSQVRLVYISNATTPALESILQHLNWSTPQLRMLVCEGTKESIKDAPLLQLNYSLPASYTIFPWVELTPEDREHIQKQQAISPWYPEIISPFQDEEIIEPVNSLGLLYQGQVVGWMITHRVAADTIRYTKLFVKQELQSIGRAIPLLVTAIKWHLHKIAANKAVFTVIVDNTSMVKFVNNRLADYLSYSRYSWEISKLL
jgi:GNAT superfamily N-acetyltransferase